MPFFSGPLVLYKRAKQKISAVFIEVRGFIVNQHYIVFI